MCGGAAALGAVHCFHPSLVKITVVHIPLGLVWGFVSEPLDTATPLDKLWLQNLRVCPQVAVSLGSDTNLQTGSEGYMHYYHVRL